MNINEGHYSIAVNASSLKPGIPKIEHKVSAIEAIKSDNSESLECAFQYEYSLPKYYTSKKEKKKIKNSTKKLFRQRKFLDNHYS